MARGSPDYGLPDYSFFAVETPVSDVVAERQGFSRLDNRGRVLWFDDFRHSLFRWQKDLDAPGTSPTHSLDLGFGVGYHGSVKLLPVGDGGTSQLFNILMLPVSKHIGIEASFYMTANSGSFGMAMQHAYATGTMKSLSMIVYPDSGDINLFTTTGQQTIYTFSDVLLLRKGFISIKMVGDMETGKYVRVMIGNEQIDVSNYVMSDGVSGLVGSSYFSVTGSGVSAVYKEPVYVAYVVISGDEP